jgi:hypothetical protein
MFIPERGKTAGIFGDEYEISCFVIAENLLKI